VSEAWLAPPRDLPLQRGEVHVWRLFLEPPPAALARILASLAPDERERAESFVFERDRVRFVAARGALRAILGSYLGISAGAVRFRYGARGKPALAGTGAAEAIEFNLSHSDTLGLAAFAVGARLGVDLERLRAVDDADGIAERFFSPRERAEYGSLEAHERVIGFFNCWTRKEAYVKAVGDGLAIPLDAFDVSLAPGDDPRLISIAGAPASAWTLYALLPARDYAAALAVEGSGWQIRRWDWDWPGDPPAIGG